MEKEEIALQLMLKILDKDKLDRDSLLTKPTDAGECCLDPAKVADQYNQVLQKIQVV